MLRTLHHPAGVREVHLGGWKKQHNDPRDAEFAIKFHRSMMLGARPVSADNRNICSAIEDQGNLGSCTAHMFSSLIEANENRKLVLPALKAIVSPTATAPVITVNPPVIAVDGSFTYTTKVVPAAPVPSPAPTPTPAPSPAPAKLVQVSRLFEYYATRKIQGTIAEDSGASIRDSIKAGALYGVADEAAYPYDIAKFKTNPAQAIWTAAAGHKVASYHAIADGDIETMKAVLSGTVPFLIGFGFTVYSAFMGLQVATTGLVTRPGKGESIQGGHAVTLVGYDDNKQMPDGSKGAFLVRNSWGTGWGLAGYFWMSQDYVSDVRLCNDFWVVQSAPV